MHTHTYTPEKSVTGSRIWKSATEVLWEFCNLTHNLWLPLVLNTSVPLSGWGDHLVSASSREIHSAEWLNQQLTSLSMFVKNKNAFLPSVLLFTTLISSDEIRTTIILSRGSNYLRWTEKNWLGISSSAMSDTRMHRVMKFVSYNWTRCAINSGDLSRRLMQSVVNVSMADYENCRIDPAVKTLQPHGWMWWFTRADSLHKLRRTVDER